MTTRPQQQTVPRIRLGADLEISQIVTGLWQIADLERDGRDLDLDRAAAAMSPYSNAGLTTFDMADHYGSAEEIAGRYVASQHQERTGKGAQLLTKWVPAPGSITKQQTRDAVERALGRLQRERIDLMQFHAWNYADPSWLDALWWLDELRLEGLIGNLGLTNTDTAHLRITLASGLPIVSNQVCVSLLDRRALGAMSTLCRERGVGLLAYGTLAGGLLSDRWRGKARPVNDEVLTWSLMKYLRFVDHAGDWDALQALLDVLATIAAKHHVSIANVACRWALDQSAVAAIIVGARLGASEHLAENQRTFSFGLDREDCRTIDAVLAQLRPIPGDCGDEYRRAPFLTASGDLSHHFEEMPAPFAVIQDDRGRLRASSATTWEQLAGYSRGVRHGNRVLISGTTATHRDRLIGGTDPAAQTHFAIDKVEGALQSLGAKLEHVVRTRVFVKNVGDWEAVAKAHGERFAAIRPANTLVQAQLIGAEYLVEIEAEAEV